MKPSSRSSSVAGGDPRERNAEVSHTGSRCRFRRELNLLSESARSTIRHDILRLASARGKVLAATVAVILATLGLAGTSRTAPLTQERTPNTGKASISGRVTLNGKPAGGIPVAVQARNTLINNALAIATTDSEGAFHFDGLRAGSYVLFPIAPAFALTNPSDPARGGMEVSVADDEQQSGVEIQLIMGGVLAGRAATVEGWPVAGVEVVAVRLEGRREILFQAGPHRRAVFTDDRGAFRLYGLPPGRYLVRTGRANANTIPLTYYPGVTEKEQSTPVELAEGSEVPDLTIVIAKPAPTYSVSGRVIDAQTRRPAGRLMLTLRQGNIPAGGGNVNANGEFQLNSVHPGKYSLQILQNAAAEYYADPVQLEVTQDDLNGIELLVRRGDRLNGQLVFEEGSPPGSAGLFPAGHLTFYPLPYGNPLWGGGLKLRPDGGFTASGLPPGKYRLVFSAAAAPGVRFGIRGIQKNGGELSEYLDVGESEQVTSLRVILIYGAAIVAGQVEAKGRALPTNTEITVLIRLSETSPTVVPGGSGRVGPNGKFRIDSLLPGTYSLSAIGGRPDPQARRFQVEWISTPQTISVTNGSPLNVTVTIRPRAAR